MDPHLRAVRYWNKDYIPNEKQAYYEARINGYVFNKDIGRFDKYELEEIASHQPSIDFKRYLYYRNMDYDQLKSKFPEVVGIIGDKVTYEDLFYYATRGWIPEYDSIDLKIKRWKTYDELSNMGKSLLNKLYGSHEDYAHSTPHSLEQTILDYDTYMDNENILISLANRVGINLSGKDLKSNFYDLLSEKIDKY